MIIRCPDCGRWLLTERKGFVGRFVAGVTDSTEVLAEVGEHYGDKIGLGGFGKLAGGAWGLAGGWTEGLNRVIKGDHYWFSCPCGWEGSTDDEDLDMSEEYEQYRREKEFVTNIRERWFKADNNEDYQGVAEDIKNHIGQCSEPCFKSSLYDYLALSFFYLGEFNEALDAINSSLRIFDFYECHGVKGVILARMTDSANFSYDALLEFNKFWSQYEDEDGLLYFNEQMYLDYYSAGYTCYANGFCDIPPLRRRYITFVDKYCGCSENVLPLRICDLPPELIFPEGTPSTGVLYVSNPVKPNVYYPSDRAEICIFRDQIDELMNVLACLGAKRVNFTEVRSSNNDYDRKRDVDVKAAGGYTEAYKGNVHVNYHGEDAAYKKIHDELSHGRTFSKGQIKPQEPKDAIFSWYPQMKDWQSLVYNRLVIGNALTDKKRISSSMESTVSASRRTQVEADFKAIEVSANAAVDVQNQVVFKESMDLCWEYEVEFYPMSDYEKSIGRPETRATDIIPNSTSTKKKPWEKLRNFFMSLFGRRNR